MSKRITEEEKDGMNGLDFWKPTRVGCFAGASEALINHPLYVLKMRSQARNHSFKLYQGLLPNMATMVLLTGIRLTLSTALTKKLDHETQLSQDHKKVFSSLMGGGFSSLVGSPMELVRYRQLISKSTFSETAKNLYKQGQVEIFFRGFLGTAMRDAIYTFGFFSLASLIKQHLKQNENHSNENDALHLTILSGAMAGIIAGIASQPFDMLKVTQQTHLNEKLSLRDSFKKIQYKHGWKGLFDGSFFRIARVASGVTIISTIYDQYDNGVSQMRKFMRGC